MKPLRDCERVNRAIALFSVLLGFTNGMFWGSFITQCEPTPSCPGEMTTFRGGVHKRQSIHVSFRTEAVVSEEIDVAERLCELSLLFMEE